MRLFAGTSGFSYPAWRGSFYPADLPPKEMLSFYSRNLPAVEINQTFYRLPTPSVLAGWAEKVPAGFLFTFKAPQRITHFKRLRKAEEETAYLLGTLAGLGERLGAVLFQFPPDFPPDLPRLADFLDLLPPGTRAAFEFRHPGWRTDDLFTLLHPRNLTLCLADTTESPAISLPATADWGYLRLRRPDYSDAELSAWRENILHSGWREAFVFFKHEEEARGPALARRFLEFMA